MACLYYYLFYSLAYVYSSIEAGLLVRIKLQSGSLSAGTCSVLVPISARSDLEMPSRPHVHLLLSSQGHLTRCDAADRERGCGCASAKSRMKTNAASRLEAALSWRCRYCTVSSASTTMASALPPDWPSTERNRARLRQLNGLSQRHGAA